MLFFLAPLHSLTNRSVRQGGNDDNNEDNWQGAGVNYKLTLYSATFQNINYNYFQKC